MTMTKQKVKGIRALARKRERQESGLFVVEGLRLTCEAADSDFVFEGAYVTREFMEDPRARDVIGKIQEKTAVVDVVSSREMNQVSDTLSSQGILAVLRQKHISLEMFFARQDQHSIVIALDAVSDPGNLGSIVRTCAWFASGGIILGRDSVDLYNPKVVRATMGGLFHLPVAEGAELGDAIRRAKSLGFTVAAAETAGGEGLNRFRPGGPALVLLGNEARGVSDALRQLADLGVSIPRYGKAESLNVGVACGILLAHLRGTLRN
jgi:TrmH family RNA methyltransferase